MACNTNLTLGPDGEAHRRQAIKKKLRLTKEQSTLLENTFRECSTLSSVEKHELAECLNLQPRQVKVWFQNRRARTKLKKTETDYEILKRNNEALAEENRRLKMENQELNFRMASCPRCQRIAAREVVHDSPSFYEFAIKKSSMACCGSTSGLYKMEERKNGGRGD